MSTDASHILPKPHLMSTDAPEILPKPHPISTNAPQILPKPHLMSTNAPGLPASFLTDPECDTHGGDSAWLGHYDVAVAILCGAVVKDVLGHLGRLAAACRPLYHRHLVALYGAYNLQVTHKTKVEVIPLVPSENTQE